MITPTYTVQLDDQESLVRIGEVIVPGVQITAKSFGIVRVAGGVPGPPGQDGASTGELVVLHVADSTPHPAYDDMPSLTLIFENGLV